MEKKPSNHEEQEWIWSQFDSLWGESKIHDVPSLPEELEQFEIKRIKLALVGNDYNRTKTAEELGIGRTRLIAKLRKYELLETVA
jgi:transcriptional regulator with PAS, ATPase and Fis domain|tara:strand:- start:1215 stop:1469 length:255 start_codon:yes stop_codon:yes gene_type:complete